MLSTFLQFVYLQVLDLLSTVVFLQGGTREGNPLVEWAMRLTGNALGGLALVKGIAVMIGLFCLFTRRARLMTKINVVYAGVVVWNLLSVILTLAYKG